MSPKEANIEKRLVSAMAIKLSSEGYKVWADHIGHPNGKPAEFNKYIPDIYAEKGSEKLIIEACDCEYLKSENSHLEWIALSAVKDVSFSIIVPKSCIQEAKKLAKEWKVEIKHYWSMDI